MPGLVSIDRNVFKNTGNSLIKGLRHNPYGIEFSDNVYNVIRKALDMADFNESTTVLYRALIDAYGSCKKVDALIETFKREEPTKVEINLQKFSELLDEEIAFMEIMNPKLKTTSSSDRERLDDEQKKKIATTVSLNRLSDEISRQQAEAKLFFRELEQRVFDKTERLLDEAETSLRNRLSDGNESLRSVQQSIRDDLDLYANRTEERIKKLVIETERTHSIFQSELKNLFQESEKDMSNRIEVRIQRAEGVATSLANQASEAREHLETVILDEKESLQTLLSDSRNTINDSIRRTSTEAAQKVQTAQTEAQESFNSFVTASIDSINERIEEKVSDYDKLKEKMEKAFKDKVSELDTQLSIVTSAVMANEHLKQAKTENKVYWVLQILGLLFMIAAIYSGSAFFSELTNIRLPFFPKPDLVIHIDGALSNAQDPTTLMFMRLSMVILLTAPAIYLLKEAAVHRHKENLYRQRGIQLATISPYLEELEKDERAAIKKELVSSFFQFHDGKTDTQNVPDFLRDMKEAANIAKVMNGQPAKSRRFGRN
ncbi:hypothetical protein ACK1CN_24925 [Vibrio coralliilyticus]|uniref:hypothetical protein n=1 Tax=Vibrio coralliilyticus TaxID=190893 RepID=UPI0039172D91